MTITSFTYNTPISFTAVGTDVTNGFTKGYVAVATTKNIVPTIAASAINKVAIEMLFGTGTGKGSLSPIGLDLKANMTVANCSTAILAAVNSQLELDQHWSGMSATIDPAFWTAFFGLLEATDPGINSITSGDTIQFVFDFTAPPALSLPISTFKVDMKYLLV